ncbi:MAG: hypothetical protein FJW36_19270 [Acidobacteria bacterium]|nr:hypothetical protein [Acidobacteriota bacterium]
MRFILSLLILSTLSPAAVSRFEILSNEPILEGTYRRIIGKVHFSLDPASPANSAVNDLKLAGAVQFSADFFLLSPEKSNGKLIYQVGNRSTRADLSDGFLTSQGFTILWMGWQWDVPEGRMRMDLPTLNNITGKVRSNFILYKRSPDAELADRNHQSYEPVSLNNPADTMTIRDSATGKPQQLPRADWQMLPGGKVSLQGGFVPGMIYEVIYEAKNPRILGASLAATRDLVAYFKSGVNPDLPKVNLAYAWGVSQSGRYLRHFLYEGFNASEQGAKVFDAIFDEVGGAGRGSFNNRFGQASRDAEQHFNFFYPVDMFPFTDGPATDAFTNKTDSLLARAEAAKTTPLMFHLLSSSEYYNRAGSLIHTDPQGKFDIEPPKTSRIYLVSSTPHFAGKFPPASQGETAAPLNPLSRAPITRALFAALDAWASKGIEPPPSQYPKLADQTLVPATRADWPTIPNVILPPPALKVYQLDFATEPPAIGQQYTTLVPALDATGHDRAGIHHPAIAVPLATYTGWNYRHPTAGAPTQLAGEFGAVFPLAKTKVTRNVVTDSRLSIAERYPTREHYVGLFILEAQKLIKQRFLLAADLPALIDQATAYYDFFSK